MRECSSRKLLDSIGGSWLVLNPSFVILTLVSALMLSVHLWTIFKLNACMICAFPAFEHIVPLLGDVMFQNCSNDTGSHQIMQQLPVDGERHSESSTGNI
jgi:hypothetical protein